MDTNDRQVTETGRNHRLGLIPAMTATVVATLNGADISFAPLYECIWGGVMLYPNCPAIGRMTYCPSNQATDDYGACATLSLWSMTVIALSVVAVPCLTIAGVQGSLRHRLCPVFSVPIAAVAVAIILVLSANTKTVTLWAMYAVTWLVHTMVTSYLSSGWIRIARLLFVWQIDVIPVLVIEYSVSGEINFSGGVTIARGFEPATHTLVQYTSLTIDSQNNSNRITPGRNGIWATSLHDLFHTISIDASAIHNCSVSAILF